MLFPAVPNHGHVIEAGPHASLLAGRQREPGGTPPGRAAALVSAGLQELSLRRVIVTLHMALAWGNTQVRQAALPSRRGDAHAEVTSL